jgi:hypothetical protein
MHMIRKRLTMNTGYFSNNINRLILLMETVCILCEVEIKFNTYLD